MRRPRLLFAVGATLAAAAAVLVPSSTAGCGCWSDEATPLWSPDGKSILETLSGESWSWVGIKAVRGGTPFAAQASTPDAALGVWAPDGRRFAYWSDDTRGQSGTKLGSIWVNNAAGTPGRRASAAKAAAAPGLQRISWLADGRRVAFTAADGSVAILDVDSGEQRTLAAGILALASPDGTRVAFQRDGIIWLVGSDGTGERALNAAGRSLRDLPGSWSPDGRSLAFTRVVNPSYDGCATSNGCAVLVADVESGATMTVAADGSHPAWSPDGGRIAYAAEGIAVVRPDGSGRHLLTDHAYSDDDPAWSPDGRRIAFAGPGGYGGQLFVIGADGTGLRNLSGNCATTPKTPFGLFCLYRGGTSVPVASAQVPLRLRGYFHSGLNDLWTGRCRCFEQRIAVRDASGSRVRGIRVRVTSVPPGLVRPLAGGSTTTYVDGTVSVRLRATASLRARHPKILTLRVDASGPHGRPAGRVLLRLELPPR